jgi:NTP pyrophosphatase (non-canonical NTP hydrolase)
MRLFQSKLRKFSKERGWLRNVRPDNYAKSIAIESAELLEEFQWINPTAREVITNPKALKRIRYEIADILIYCINLANLLQLDVDKIIEEKIQYNATKYPPEVLRDDPKMYFQIKREYRRWEL